MPKPEDVVGILEELEHALEAFRTAYTAWLAGEGDRAALERALAVAEARLDAARTMLAAAGD